MLNYTVYVNDEKFEFLSDTQLRIGEICDRLNSICKRLNCTEDDIVQIDFDYAE